MWRRLAPAHLTHPFASATKGDCLGYKRPDLDGSGDLVSDVGQQRDGPWEEHLVFISLCEGLNT